ncbi:O-antigen ligase family protein [Herbaspirillum frisingense]|uniref:O-antigen ligase family protein n=1 Tax=Herbaspirillum frisingense TaxID=92645 RepID=UPI001F173618|nr:O-antigen ligase family protein [Herbaspirillum frisingense]
MIEWPVWQPFAKEEMMRRINLPPSELKFLLAACVIAAMAGLVLPVVAGLLEGSYARLAALPALLIFGGLFLFNKRLLLLIVLLLRASGDIVLESTRVGSGGSLSLGLGGAINGLIILMAFLFFIERPKLLPRKAWLYWMILMVVAFAGMAVSPDKGAALKIVLGLCSYFAVFVCAFYLVRTPEEFRSMVLLILASSLIPAVYGLVSTALNARGGLSGFRLQGTFGHPNIFAFYLTLVIALGLYVIKSAEFKLDQFKRFVLAGYLGVLFLLLLLTQTRSAWVACFLIFFLYGVKFERRYLVYMLVLGTLALMVPSVQERILQLDSGNTVTTYAKLNSFAWRTYLWQSGLNWMTPSHYIFGYGVEAFPFYSGMFFPLAGGVKWGAHSVFVQWFFDTGLVGMVAYLAIFYQVMRVLIRYYSVDKLGAVILICTLIEYLVVSASDNMLSYLAFNWYFWLVMGMGWSVYANSEAGKQDAMKKKRTALQPVPAVSS